MSTATNSAPAARPATGPTAPSQSVNPSPRLESSAPTVSGLKQTLSASLAKAFQTTSPEASLPTEQGSSSTETDGLTHETPETNLAPTAPNVSTEGDDGDAAPAAPAPNGDASNLSKALKAERAEKKALKAQLKALQEQLKAKPAEPDDAAETVRRPETPETETSPKQQVQHLTKVVGQIKTWLRTARTNPDAVVAELTRLNMPVTTETVEAWLEEQRDAYSDQLMDAKVEERFEREATGYQARNLKQTAEQAAAQWVPELADPDSPEAQRFAELQSRHPGLAEDPLATALLAAAVVGFKAIEGKAKPAASATPASKAATAAAPVILPKRNGTPRPTTDGAAAPDGQATITPAQLLNRFAETRDEKDAAAFKRVYGMNLLGRMVRN